MKSSLKKKVCLNPDMFMNIVALQNMGGTVSLYNCNILFSIITDLSKLETACAKAAHDRHSLYTDQHGRILSSLS